MGKNESTFGDIAATIEKWAAHPTDKKLEEDKEDQPESPDESTVKDLAGAGVEKGKSPKDSPKSPAEVPEEASTDYKGDVDTPPQPSDHPTNKELKDQPAKAAELSSQLEEVGSRLQKSAADLLSAIQEPEDDSDGSDKTASAEEEDEAVTKEAKNKDYDEKDSSDSEEEMEEDDSEEEDSEENQASADDAVDMVQAGYEGAAKTAGALMQLQATQTEQELAKYAEAGAMDASALADQLDAAVGPALMGPAPDAPAGPAGPDMAPAEEESVMTLEEVKAIAEALKSGKEPETPQEQEVYDFLMSLGVAPEKSEEPKEPKEAPAEETAESPPSDVEAEEGAKAKMASYMANLSDQERNELIRMLVTPEDKE